MKVQLDEQYLHVELDDGRVISTPLKWYPELLRADEGQKRNFKLIGKKTMIEWSDLELHLDIEEMFKVVRDEEAA